MAKYEISDEDLARALENGERLQALSAEIVAADAEAEGDGVSAYIANAKENGLLAALPGLSNAIKGFLNNTSRAKVEDPA